MLSNIYEGLRLNQEHCLLYLLKVKDRYPENKNVQIKGEKFLNPRN